VVQLSPEWQVDGLRFLLLGWESSSSWAFSAVSLAGLGLLFILGLLGSSSNRLDIIHAEYRFYYVIAVPGRQASSSAAAMAKG
jgi:hypothetical protein